MRIALLRAVNVGGTGKLAMAELREVCAEIGLQDVTTYIQTGNIVFRDGPVEQLAPALAQSHGLRTEVILRTLEEWRRAIAANPFPDAEPARLLYYFLAADPPPESVTAAESFWAGPEQVRVLGRQAYLHFPNGIGASRFPFPKLEKLLGCPGTGRNANTVNKLLELASR